MSDKFDKLVEGVDFVYVACYNGRRIRHDVKDHDPQYKDVLYKAFMEAEDELPVPWDDPPNFSIAQLQKKILKERYGIEYRTFYELNPGVACE